MKDLHTIGVKRLEVIQQVIVTGKEFRLHCQGLTALNTQYHGFHRIRQKVVQDAMRLGTKMPGMSVVLEVIGPDGRLWSGSLWRLEYMNKEKRAMWESSVFVLRIAQGSIAGFGPGVVGVEVEDPTGVTKVVKDAGPMESAGLGGDEWREPSTAELVEMEYEGFRDCVRKVRRKATLDEAYNAARTLISKWEFYISEEGERMGFRPGVLENWRQWLRTTGGYNLDDVLEEAKELVAFKEQGTPLPARTLQGQRLAPVAPIAPAEISSPNLAAWTPVQVARLLDGYGEIDAGSEGWATFLAELEKREGTAVKRLVEAEAARRVAEAREGAL